MYQLGTKTKYGKICGVMWIGERYYFVIKKGVVSLIPETAIDQLIDKELIDKEAK
jgi:hypothetical protein